MTFIAVLGEDGSNVCLEELIPFICQERRGNQNWSDGNQLYKSHNDLGLNFDATERF